MSVSMDSCRTISFAKSRMRESRTSGSVEGLALQGASLLDKLDGPQSLGNLLDY